MTNSRRMLVLRAVVEDYIRSQEPVGSSALTRKHSLGVSSATVRNDMAVLEDEGYLIQPHTSAGRIPTEKGYRYFVDKLATIVPLSPAQRRGIRAWLSGSASLDDTLQRAAQLLAQITGQVAVVASPSLAKSTLRRLELIPLTSDTLLVVVITDAGHVAQHALTYTPDPVPDTAGIEALEKAINEQCHACSLQQVARFIGRHASTGGFARERGLARQLSAVFERMGSEERSTSMYMYGTAQLAHRGMADLRELAPLFDALEEQVVLMKLMSALSEVTHNHGVSVAIGSETHTPGLMHASVVASGYGRSTADHAGHDSLRAANSGSVLPRARGGMDSVEGLSADTNGGDEDERDAANETDTGAPDGGNVEPVAFVGSIGPTHMDYVATIAAVRAVARYLTGFLAREEDSGADGR